MASRRQGRYWFGTLPWTPEEISTHVDRNACLSPPIELDEVVIYAKGQGELGAGGLYHWQVLVTTSRKVSGRQLQQSIPRSGHWELSRSTAADDYVWKEDTRIDGTQFELGRRAFKSNSEQDWDRIWNLARDGQWLDIPANIRGSIKFILVCHYSSLRKISSDFARPVANIRRVLVYWGPTGTGKTRRAWDEGGMDAYPKVPSTKFWDGYQGILN